jgi:hypothetical protein
LVYLDLTAKLTSRPFYRGLPASEPSASLEDAWQSECRRKAVLAHVKTRRVRAQAGRSEDTRAWQRGACFFLLRALPAQHQRPPLASTFAPISCHRTRAAPIQPQGHRIAITMLAARSFAAPARQCLRQANSVRRAPAFAQVRTPQTVRCRRCAAERDRWSCV